MTARTPREPTGLASPVTLTPLLGFPDVRRGDSLADLVLEALQHNEIELLDGDILVVSSKIASKALGLTAPRAERDETVLAQSVRVVAERMTPWGVTRIVESVAGPVMAAAGVDASNTADESIVLVLPGDPDTVAADIRGDLEAGWATRSGNRVRVGVVLSDTAGRPWRIGQVDFALGAAGIQVTDDLRGSTDADGRVLSVTERCIADEIAAAADLVKGKAAGTPVAHVRGLSHHVADRDAASMPGRDAASMPGRDAASMPGRDAASMPGREPTSGARDLVRTGPGDWFAYGAQEAVRAALGVEPGSAEATAVGIRSTNTETVADEASRALRVALLACPDATGEIDGDTIRIAAVDDFALGVVVTRVEVALRGEGLATTLTRGDRTRPSALIGFH